MPWEYPVVGNWKCSGMSDCVRQCVGPKLETKETWGPLLVTSAFILPKIISLLKGQRRWILHLSCQKTYLTLKLNHLGNSSWFACCPFIKRDLKGLGPRVCRWCPSQPCSCFCSALHNLSHLILLPCVYFFLEEITQLLQRYVFKDVHGGIIIAAIENILNIHQ